MTLSVKESELGLEFRKEHLATNLKDHLLSTKELKRLFSTFAAIFGEKYCDFLLQQIL
jgi:hypothetical protein